MKIRDMGSESVTKVSAIVSRVSRMFPDIYGRCRNVPEGCRRIYDVMGCLSKSRRFYNRCIHVSLSGKEFYLKAI
jgi:hypothetical protein